MLKSQPMILTPGDAHWPQQIEKRLGRESPSRLHFLGNLDILQTKPVALFCSVKCPGNLILQTYDLAQKWRDQGVTVISGFHSPMERECLSILLRSPHAFRRSIVGRHGRGRTGHVPVARGGVQYQERRGARRAGAGGCREV